LLKAEKTYRLATSYPAGENSMSVTLTEIERRLKGENQQNDGFGEKGKKVGHSP